MKRVLKISAIAIFTCLTTACDGIFDDFFRKDDEESDNNTENTTIDIEKEYPVAKYEKFVKSISVDRGISNNPYASEILLYLSYYSAEFQYDEVGRPTSVERTCYSPHLGLNYIKTQSEFQYCDSISVNLLENRIDYGNDTNGTNNVVYEYPTDLYSFSPFYCLNTMSAPYWDLKLTHDKDGRLLTSEQKWKTENKTYSYKLEYNGKNMSSIDNLSYLPDYESLWNISKHPKVNIDYNMLLLTSDFLNYCFGGSLPMIFRMGGNVGENLMKVYFAQNGSNGHGYYGYFPKEDAGKTLHFKGNYVNYNEDWQGGPVEYVFEGDYVKQIKISLPVVFYEYEYDVVVGTTPLDPNDPDSVYYYERFENETSKVLTSCNVEYEYNFTYCTKNDL